MIDELMLPMMCTVKQFINYELHSPV